MSSKPTPREKLYAWHTQAIENKRNHLDIEAQPDDPQCGWYARRLVPGGVEVPCRIFMEQPTDEESGDLIGDEVMLCEVDFDRKDPFEEWSWLCGNPITEIEFDYLKALRRYCGEHAPNEPYADPRKPVDWSKLPPPTFSTKETA